MSDTVRRRSDRPQSVFIATGVSVPYPAPSSPEATAIGRANRGRDTRAEVALRSALHRMGLRFRKHVLVRTSTLKTHPDVTFTRAKVAVFVDGCFWHVCPEHCHVPKSNRDYWVPKLRANVARDRAVDVALVADGWLPIRVWEHEQAVEAATRIAHAVRERR